MRSVRQFAFVVVVLAAAGSFGLVITATPPAAARAVPAGETYSCSGQTDELLDTGNIDGVKNNGTPPSFSTDGVVYCLTSIETYHWNDMKGATPGKLSLERAGGAEGKYEAKLGPYQAEGTPGQDGVPNANWVVDIPDSPKPTLIDGTYTCKDSDPTTWSQNSESGGEGFCYVWGVKYVKETVEHTVTGHARPALNLIQSFSRAPSHGVILDVTKPTSITLYGTVTNFGSARALRVAVDLTNHAFGTDSYALAIPTSSTAKIATITLGGQCIPSRSKTSPVSCYLGTLQPGRSAVFHETIAFTPQPGDATWSELSERVASLQSTGVAVDSTAATVAANSSVKLDATNADVAVEIKAPKEAYVPISSAVGVASTFAVTVIVENHGPDAATDVVVKNTIGNHYDWSSSIKLLDCPAAVLTTCHLNTLPNGKTVTFIEQDTVTPTTTLVAGNPTLTATSTVSSTTLDPNEANNVATAKFSATVK